MPYKDEKTPSNAEKDGSTVSIEKKIIHFCHNPAPSITENDSRMKLWRANWQTELHMLPIFRKMRMATRECLSFITSEIESIEKANRAHFYNILFKSGLLLVIMTTAHLPCFLAAPDPLLPDEKEDFKNDKKMCAVMGVLSLGVFIQLCCFVLDEFKKNHTDFEFESLAVAKKNYLQLKLKKIFIVSRSEAEFNYFIRFFPDAQSVQRWNNKTTLPELKARLENFANALLNRMTLIESKRDFPERALAFLGGRRDQQSNTYSFFQRGGLDVSTKILTYVSGEDYITENMKRTFPLKKS